MKEDERFLTIRQAAKRGPLSERTMRALLAAGELPGFYLGNYFRVDHKALVEKLAELSKEGGKLL